MLLYMFSFTTILKPAMSLFSMSNCSQLKGVTFCQITYDILPLIWKCCISYHGLFFGVSLKFNALVFLEDFELVFRVSSSTFSCSGVFWFLLTTVSPSLFLFLPVEFRVKFAVVVPSSCFVSYSFLYIFILANTAHEFFT